MLICDEQDETIIIESILEPIISNYFWALNLDLLDFTLEPITMVAEKFYPSILVEVNRFKFILPAEWNLLVYDDETMQLDVVEISDLSISNFTALLGGPKYDFAKPAQVKTLDYKLRVKSAYPSLNKHQMLCHPVSPDSWVMIAPSDSYSKYLKEKTVGDIF